MFWEPKFKDFQGPFFALIAVLVIVFPKDLITIKYKRNKKTTTKKKKTFFMNEHCMYVHYWTKVGLETQRLG